ncbi:sigma-70 family RNA polymerase sigma factor [Litoribacter ruber]|uniref:Sigma-70 family RNA polymerase sigma factor n=1 Tax=Litoribacter ruber TaxID=702568 RepID=A0AAP2CHH9_9BACT|nr:MULTISPECIES: sigma-70 family RNA polymerase sigma factor [Litoribacter]MBS9523900.1 sigma-70 family RNA polymerase sigma factor [Litoribacter alkaliphilus]MBT0811507.1 sigma-70 family RNA polymerase sigma factor [Litoribacter ruber]
MLFRKTFTEEADIIKGCLRGDRKAQRVLYDAYSGKFLAIAIRYVKDRDLAEDIMIEGFMKIFDKLAQFEGKGSFEGWMKRIIVTNALLTLRNQRNLLMEVNQESESVANLTPYEFTDMETADLLAMIGELSVGYRTVFNLYAIEGYSHPEIADLLGISENTSKSQLSRARAILKQKLTDQNLKERSISG